MYQAKGLHGNIVQRQYVSKAQGEQHDKRCLCAPYAQDLCRPKVQKSHHRDGYFTSMCRRATRKLHQQRKNYHAR